MANCHETRVVRARKPHTCNCHRSHTTSSNRLRYRNRRCSVSKGKFYVVDSGIFDGNPYREKLCIFHKAVVRAIWKSERETMNSWSFEGVDLSGSWEDYIQVCSSKDWRMWLGLIRAEYRKLKMETKRVK